MMGWGKLAFDRITRHEEECGKRWDYARHEAKETRDILSKKVDEAVFAQTVRIERVTAAQNKMIIGVAGAVISVLLSILGALLHKEGLL